MTSEDFWGELDGRHRRGERFIIDVSPREAVHLEFLLRLALRDPDVEGLWKSTELAARITESLQQWLAETPLLARHVAECAEWERKYEPSFRRD